MEKDLNYFARLWSRSQPNLKADQKLWDFRADDFNRHRSSDEGQQKIQRVINFLLHKKLLDKESAVLDIGCGPGSYALELAKIAKKVTAIDISPNMIKHGQQKAIAAGQNNVNFEVSPWETLDIQQKGWQKQFDLVFASMCPGINSHDSLLKMIQASRGFCFLSSFAYRQDKVKDALHEIIHQQQPGSRWGKNMYCIFNLLWLGGYYPSICYHDSSWTNQWPLEKAIQLYTLQLTRGHQLTDEQNQQLQDYLNKISVDGMVTENVKAKVAWLYWSV